MATTVLPLHPDPMDLEALAHLEAAIAHVPADRWGEFAHLVRGAVATTVEGMRHRLVVVDERHDDVLVEPLRWVDGRLEPRPTVLPAVACRWSPPHSA